MFYWFNQNNSYGRWDIDEKVCHRVIIEADSLMKALDIAEDIGIYFNGVDMGIDCPCCGDRWYLPEEIAFPINYDTDIVFNTAEEYAQFLANTYGMTTPDIRIFYKDGTVKEFVTIEP